MIAMPTDTVTFLFTDIEGSTKRWEHYPRQMKSAIERHDAILRGAIEANGGVVFRTEGDAFRAAFGTALPALLAAIQAQRGLDTEHWPEEISPLRVRMALHTGAIEKRDGDYVGPSLNRMARLLAVANGGQTLLSLPTEELVRDNLPPGVTLRDLGEHRLKDLLRPERIFQLTIEGLVSEFPRLTTLDAHPNNLPTQSTLFIGRDKVVEAICKTVLQPDIRLVTLTGPGGTGKTRLSLQAATALIDNFTDGVFFVALAPVTDPGFVGDTIAQVLGIGEAESGSDTAGNLKKYLQNKQLLLILDNFEQVVKAAPLVREILSACRGVKVLVTSREVLHLYGEKEYVVPPMTVPYAPGATSKHRTSVEQLTQYESVLLFIERARLVKSDFAVTNENAPAVAEICYRLDGLPLAIELAAARIKLLPPQAMLSRLQSRLKLLTGGARDLPTHQQTLRGTIAWSYDLLSPEEQALFRRIAVFVGGCTLEAAEAVCNYDNGGIDVLEGISSLLDKSLLRQVDTEGEPRFFMLETLREYGLEQMEQSGEIEEVSRAHVEFYLPSSVDWLSLAGGDVSVQAWQPYMERLVPEMDNSRAASNWLLEHNTDDAMALCSFLSYFWHDRGYHSEAQHLVDRALALPGASTKPGYPEALILSGSIAQTQGNMAQAAARFESALALMKQKRLEAPETFAAYVYPGITYGSYLGWALGHLAGAIASQEGPAGALDVVIEGVEELRASGNDIALGMSEVGLGTAYAFRGELDKARSTLEEALAIGRKHGERFLIAASAQMLGDVDRIQGDFKMAGPLYQENIDLSRALGLGAEMSAAFHNVAYVELGQGNAERARELFMQSVAAQRDAEHMGGIAETLAGFGALAAYQGQAERAMRLYGAAMAIWDSNHLVIWPAEQAEYERYTSRARAQLDEATAKRAWEEGYATSIQSLEQALEFAMQGELQT